MCHEFDVLSHDQVSQIDRLECFMFFMTVVFKLNFFYTVLECNIYYGLLWVEAEMFEKDCIKKKERNGGGIAGSRTVVLNGGDFIFLHKGTFGIV